MPILVQTLKARQPMSGLAFRFRFSEGGCPYAGGADRLSNGSKACVARAPQGVRDALPNKG